MASADAAPMIAALLALGGACHPSTVHRDADGRVYYSRPSEREIDGCIRRHGRGWNLGFSTLAGRERFFQRCREIVLDPAARACDPARTISRGAARCIVELEARVIDDAAAARWELLLVQDGERARTPVWRAYWPGPRAERGQWGASFYEILVDAETGFIASGPNDPTP